MSGGPRTQPAEQRPPNLTHAALRQRPDSPHASFAPSHFPTNMAAASSQKGVDSMAIEKCINEFDVNEVIFEEGSTGRELFVVLEGKIDIAKINGASKTVIVTLGKGEFFGEMAVIDGSSRSATAIAAAPNTRVMRINHARFVYLVSQQPAFAGQDRHAGSEPGASRSHRCGLSFRRPPHHRRASVGRQQDHAAR